MKQPETNMPAFVRLERSRSALQQALQSRPMGDTSNNPAIPLASKPSGLAGLRLLQGKPSAFLLMQALQQMWATSPWHLLGQSAYQAADMSLKPIAQRSPIKLVAGAFVMGALLLWARPWRLMPKGALLGAIWPR